MKKLLLSTIIILILVLIIITAINGLQIGGLEILGIKEIKAENEELDILIKQATKLASTDYQKKIDDLGEAEKQLKTQKQNYDDMVNVSTDSEVQAANQLYKNMIEFLLIRIENHAKAEGVTMKMDITRSASGAEEVYDLNFTVTGGYAQIEEFITDIEDDSKLGYKIEEFKMIASSENGSVVQSTFVCKDIRISGITSNSNIPMTDNTDKQSEVKDAAT